VKRHTAQNTGREFVSLPLKATTNIRGVVDFA